MSQKSFDFCALAFFKGVFHYSSNEYIQQKGILCMKRGQTTLELLVLISASLVALAIIYSLYSGQVDSTNVAKEASIAQGTIGRMVDSANSLYISGAGSSARVFIDIPESLQMESSGIFGRAVLLKLSNGTETFGTADVNFSGSFKRLGGDYVTGGYFANLSFDGNTVSISYGDFELSNESLSYYATSGTIVEGYFNVRNVSDQNALFWSSLAFSHSPYATITLSSGAESFVLAPQETKRIDFNIDLSNLASGNYSGSVDIIGQVNDGVTDSNITKQVTVSVESYLESSAVAIYPKSTSITAFAGTSTLRTFSLCNSSNDTISITSWGRDSNKDANMLLWFNWSPTDSQGAAITEVSSGACTNFDLNFSIPISALQNVYDANFSANYSGGSSTSYVFISVIPPAYTGTSKYLFFTSQNDFNSNTNWFSSYFSASTSLNRASPTGELDWNKNANYSFNSADYNRDINGLVGYWKLNDKNAQGWVLNSATGVRDGNLVGGADTNAVGLWDTNAGWFNGVNGCVKMSNFPTDMNGKSITILAWIKPYAPLDVHDLIFSTTMHSVYFALSGANTLTFFPSSGGGSVTSSSISGTYGKWMQVAVNFDTQSHNGSFYFNGGLVNNFSISSDLIIKSNGYIGSWNGSARFFNGSIEEFKIYNRVLSASEIAADYNSFLQSKYSSAILDLNSSPSHKFNSIKVNSDTNYNFGSELSAGEKFFDQNLIGLWHFNDKNAQGWVLNSVTGVRDGNLVNGADTNAVGLWDSNAGYFDGSNDYVSVLQNGRFNLSDSAFSIGLWVWDDSPYSSIGTYHRIVSWYDGSKNIQLGLGQNNTSPNRMFYLVNGSLNANVMTAGDISQGYHFVVAVKDGVNYYIYLDGMPSIGAAYTRNDIVSYSGDSTYLYIGSRSPGQAPTKGTIEEVAIWNRALSASEVSDLYRKGVARLDLNVYSCSDAGCNSVVDVNKFINVQNNIDLNISSMVGARYFKYNAGFNNATNFPNGYTTGAIAVTGFPFISDVNFKYFS